MDTIIDQTVAMAAPVIGAIIVSLLGIGLKRVNDWIRAQVKSREMQTAMLQVAESVVSTVMDLEATVRKHMSDRKLTRDEQADMKGQALARVTHQVPAALRILAEAGIKDLDAYVAGKIEQAVLRLPKSTGGAS